MDRHTNAHTETKSKDTAVFLNQKRAIVCEHTTKMASLEFLKGATRGVARGMDGGEFKRRLSEAVPRGQNELVCRFNMAAGDMG